MNEPRPGFLPVDDYLRQPRERGTWLLKPLIPVSGAALIYAQPKMGKSYLGIQLALALTGQAPDWLGFPVVRTGKVLYFQLDTPRSTWIQRFEDMIQKGGLKYDSNSLLLADRESVEYFPFDILQPTHVKYLASIVQVHQPVAVIIDTLREVHSGDEDTSTTSRNVIANLIGATHPAALILISHSRKPNPDAEKSIMDDHRGSSYITGKMDAIMRLTRNKLYYAGRSIEEGNIKIERLDNGLWAPKADLAEDAALAKVLADPQLPTLRAKARAFATLTTMNEETAMSRLRRHISKPVVERNGDRVDLSTGEVVESGGDGVNGSTADSKPVSGGSNPPRPATPTAVDILSPLVLNSALPRID